MDLNDKREYIQFIDSVCKSLKNDKFFKEFTTELGNGKNTLSIYRSQKKKSIDTDWIDMIAGSIVALDNIVRNPRRFIIREEEIVPIALSKSITTESIKHLAQHTNFISEVKGDTITPNKILNINKEESFEIYENRFAYTLLLRLKQFIDKRTEIIKSSMTDNDIVNVDLHSKFKVGDKSLDYTIQLNTKASDADLEGGDDTAVQLERIMKMSKVVDDFCSSPFAMSMKNYALVRPPITRTNVILKNPDFKKALSLWQFIETYDKTGFEVVTTESLEDVPTESNEYLSNNLFINYLFYKNLIEINNPNEKVERKNKYAPKFVKKFLETVVKSGEIDDVELRNVIKEAYYGQHVNNQLDKKQVKNINSIIDSCLAADEKYLIKLQKEKEAEERRLAEEEAKRQREIEARLERARIAQEKKEEREREKLAKQKALEEEQAKIGQEIQDYGVNRNKDEDFDSKVASLIELNNKINEPKESDPIIYKKITSVDDAIDIINNAFRYYDGTVFSFADMFEGEEDIDDELLEEYDDETSEEENSYNDYSNVESSTESVQDIIANEFATVEETPEVSENVTTETPVTEITSAPSEELTKEQEALAKLAAFENGEITEEVNENPVDEVAKIDAIIENNKDLTEEQLRELEIMKKMAAFEESGEEYVVNEETDKEKDAISKVESYVADNYVKSTKGERQGLAPTINTPKKKSTTKKKSSSTKKKSTTTSKSTTAKKSTSTSKKSTTTSKSTSAKKSTKPTSSVKTVKAPVSQTNDNKVSIDSANLPKDGLKIEINIVGDKVEVKKASTGAKKSTSSSTKKKTSSSSTKKKSTTTKKSTSGTKKKSTTTKKKTSTSSKKTTSKK